MPKALIVSSHFPPYGSAGGSIRLVKFIRHISEMGWKFSVLAQDAGNDPLGTPQPSYVLLDELPADIVVRRIAAFNASKPSGIGSSYSSIPWGMSAFRAGIAEMVRSPVHLIFGVAPPFTNALTAWMLSKVSRKPLILDFKDDWVGSPTFLKKSSCRQKFEKFLEAVFVRDAAAVITVTPQSFRIYTERYRYLKSSGKFHLVPNGCDLAEFHALQRRERMKVADRFLILSAAWGYRKDYRDLAPFLFALDLFFKTHPDAKRFVDVILLGDSLSAEYDDLISDLSLNKAIQSWGVVERKELLEWLWRADLFLLVQPIGNATAISGTLYEYWATGKAPVLLISEIGASSDLVEMNAVGRTFRFDQVEGIADYIAHLYERFRSGTPVWIERDGVEFLDRRTLSKRMEEIWRSLIERA